MYFKFISSFGSKMNSIKYLKRRALLKIMSFLPLPDIPPSSEEIDIVIPVIEKDLDILPLCLEGVKKNVQNRIKNIYLVAPQNNQIMEFCRCNSIEFVDETTVLGFGPKELCLKINEKDKIVDRSGWLFQQLIKLSGRVGTCDHYLCIDSDHILLRPHTFLAKNGNPVFYVSSEMHSPYYDNIKRITSMKKMSALSYVAHKMLFSKKKLNELHKNIEEKCKTDWIAAILENYDRSQQAGFSEFELYGNFVRKKYVRPWKQKAFSYMEKNDYDYLVSLYGKKYNSITFPAYMN